MTTFGKLFAAIIGFHVMLVFIYITKEAALTKLLYALQAHERTIADLRRKKQTAELAFQTRCNRQKLTEYAQTWCNLQPATIKQYRALPTTTSQEPQ